MTAGAAGLVAGLVAAARTSPDTTGARLASWLLHRAAHHPDVRLEPAHGAHGALVLLVAQHGAGPSPEIADLVAQADRWHGRAVALVAYGGVSRGRDAADAVATALCSAGATVLDAVLGVNAAVMRREGGPGAFEELAFRVQLDDLAAAALSARHPQR